MIIKVTFKDPDAVYEAVQEAVEKSLKASGLSEEEVDAVEQVRMNGEMEKVKKWFRWGEYADIEIDTEAGTAKVLEAKD